MAKIYGKREWKERIGEDSVKTGDFTRRLY